MRQAASESNPLRKLFQRLMLLLVPFYVFVAYSNFQDVRLDYERTLAEDARLLTEAVRATMTTHAAMLLSVGEGLLSLGTLERPENGRSLIERMADSDRGMAGFGIARTDGQLILVSRAPADAKLPNLMANEESRASFEEALRSNRIHAGRAYFFKTLGEWVIPIRMALPDASGHARAVMTAGYRIDGGTAAWARMALGQGISVLLLHDDGYALYQYPLVGDDKKSVYEKAYGQPSALGLVEQLRRLPGRSGIIEVVVDGTPVLAGWQFLDEYGLYALTVKPVRDLAASQWASLMSPTLWLCAFLLGGLALYRQTRRLQRAADAQQRTAEQEASRQRDIAQRYLDIAGVMLLALDTRGRIVMINRQGCQLLGKPEAELLGADWFEEFVPADDRAAVRRTFEKILRGEAQVIEHYENKVVDAAGKEMVLAWKNSVLRDDAGTITGTLSSAEDVTERNRVQQLLRESRERFDLAVRGSSDGIWDWNIETGTTYVSERWCEMLGYQPGEVHFGPKGWTHWIHPDDKFEALDQMRRHLRTREPYASEYRMPMKSGEYHWFLNRGQAVWNEQGRAIRIAGSTSDITERKVAEAALRLSEEKFAKAFRSIPILLSISTVAEGRYIDVNECFLQTLGHTRDAVIGRTAHEIGFWKHPEDRQRAIDALRQDGRLVRFASEMCDASGRSLYCEIRGEPITIDGEPCIVLATMDVTERKTAEDQLRKLSLAVQQSPESIVITNLRGEIEYVNDAFVQKTGYSREEAIGKNPRILHSGKTPTGTFTVMWETLLQGRSWSGEFHNRRKDGSDYIEHAVITPIRQSDGTVTHYVAVKEDITVRKASEEKINILVFYDPLTELPNRRLLRDRLKQALAASARNKRYGALLFIDLDNFKTLNDTLGHDIGDLLLLQVAQRLTTCVREGDTVARLGGDEFVVMLEDLSGSAAESAAHAKTVGEKILSALNQSYKLANYLHHSTPSIGVTLFSDQQESIDELLKRADLAMYQAKAAGRNTLRFFDPEMQAVVTKRAALEADLREGVRGNQFLLHYQAQVIGERRVTGVEVLLRWRHPQRGAVSPAEFIPLAEDIGLILPLGHWVLETACAQLKRWEEQPALAHLMMAVNVSAKQVRHKDFADQVLAILEHSGANPRRLKLELTESLMVEDVESVIAKMNALKLKGVGFSLDDFGTGYSSLSYLKRLPLDQLKIDQGFVRDILTDPDDAAIAKMVIALSESLGLAVIAEGVEIEAQREFLAYHGCHAYQGYLFSRPLPLEDFEHFANKAFDDEQRLLSA